MNKNSKILIVGHGDIVENSLLKHFRSTDYQNVYSASEIGMNPTIQPSVYEFFSKYKPEFVFLGSTRSGGIEANQKLAGEFLYHNSESQNNVIHSAYKFGVKKLLYFAGSCAYPKEAPQPMKEDCLLTGPLEVTSEAYSIAKIAGIKLCQSYRKQYGLKTIVAVLPTLYGIGGDTDLEKAHVIGALVGKFYKAVTQKEEKVTIWGTGQPQRDFLFADDLVDASLFLMEHYDDSEILNVSCGCNISIKELAELIKNYSKFPGEIVYDSTKSDGTMKKLLDTSKVNRLGWKAKVNIEEGVRRTYEWYAHKNEGELVS